MLVDTAGGVEQSDEVERRRKEQEAADGLLAVQLQGEERRREVANPAAVFNAKVGEMEGMENPPPRLPVNRGAASDPEKRPLQEKIIHQHKNAEDVRMERNHKDLEALKLKNQQQQFDLHAAQIAGRKANERVQSLERQLQQRQYVRQDFDAPQHARQPNHPQEEGVWYTKTSKKKSPKKVGGQYVVPNPSPTCEEAPTAHQPEVRIQPQNSHALEVF